jgi:predicted deacetylase
MSAKYIIRLDDACPTMNGEKWDRIEQILDRYNIKPIVAVIPNNEDEKQRIDEYDLLFWDKVKKWQQKGWDIALHGYSHVYSTKNGGLVFKTKKNSEFAGIPFDIQEEKIKKGMEIFNQYGIKTRIWVAPSHTFDENTLKALRKHTQIEIISDGITLNPYKKYGFTWIPCNTWKFRYYIYGYWTICVHPNTIAENTLLEMITFIEKHRKNIINVKDIYKINENINLLDHLFSFLFWKIRNIKKLLSHER